MKYEVVQLGDICDFTYGDSLKETVRNGGNVPVYGSNGIVGWHDKPLTKGETLIVGRKGSIGEVHLSKIPCWPIDTTYYIEKTKVPCDFTWLYYMLLSIDLTRLNKSAAVPGLNRDDAYEQRLPLPPLPEQHRIAAMLRRTDDLRRMQRYADVLSASLLRSVFLEMFGDPLKNSNKLEVGKLAGVGTLERGRSKNRPRNAPELYGGKYPFIQTGDIANAGTYIRSYQQTYSELGLKQSRLWKSGTLCITIAANIAKTAIMTFDACFPDSVVGFNPNKKVNVEYIQCWLSFLQKKLEETAPESAQKNINLEILRDLDIPVPPLSEQERFARVVRWVEALRRRQAEARRQGEGLFQGLLHQSFGEDENEFHS